MNISKKEFSKVLSTMFLCFAGASIYYVIRMINPDNASSFAVLCVIYIMYREHKSKLKNIFLH